MICQNCEKPIKKKEKPAFFDAKRVCQKCFRKRKYTPLRTSKWILEWRRLKAK